ncbi:acyl-CoA/acyl-ACP dehydrogenase (plasmid) [Deinococcus sp. KNUC1210]|uniref:acyl-CoA dehydrogenase family protein n=1 Tax=Deinococcus sp. KNUC1210 TaxID=2917691 RepID=UPI001EEFB573|nr:acyl-CoA dehydrogenase family protein [Deinococcus sp. KNUC1210]ULH14129.1 acyl-CoA/acyl-ACP dehydrogenase [Deinococcus sp. KNUC1210]
MTLLLRDAERAAHLQRLSSELAARFRADAARADAAGELSEASMAALKASGYPALTVPTRLGGLGATLLEVAQTQETLGSGDASAALIAAMNAHLLGSLAESGGWSQALYAEVCRASVERGALANSLASEPELGSPSRGGLPATRAEQVPGGWHVSGRKTWSTGVRALDFLVVSAATPQEQVWRFVIPSAAPGVSIQPTWSGSLSLRASGSDDVLLEEVFVPDSHAIPPTPSHPAGSAWFWTAVAATYLGVGQAALDALKAYAWERVPTALGQPIATLPKVQEAAGRMELELLAARSVLHAVCHEWSEQPGGRAALLPRLAAAKSLCTNAAVSVTDQALRVAGGAALTASLPLERLLRDARAGLTHPPSDEQALAMLGRGVLERE